MKSKISSIRSKTIRDFGNQFQRYNDIKNDNYWSGLEHITDLLGDTFNLDEINGKYIGEVGSGSGRIVHILSKLKPKLIFSIEPSKAIDVQKINNKSISNIEYHNISGSEFKLSKQCDYIFSLGVIHHIKKPDDVIKNIYDNLNKDGVFICSVYAKEKNKFLIFLLFILGFTSKISDNLLDKFSMLLNIILSFYILLCKIVPLNLPMKKYLINRFIKNTFKNRTQIIFDQLNPAYAKFYTKSEIKYLLENNGFQIIKIFDSAENNWGVRAKKLNN